MVGRYVIYGTGAIGGIVGSRLQTAGHDVVFIARGRTLETLRRDGLTLRTADARRTFKVECVATPAEAAITPNDAVILAMKTQDTVGALCNLAECAPAQVPGRLFYGPDGTRTPLAIQATGGRVVGPRPADTWTT